MNIYDFQHYTVMNKIKLSSTKITYLQNWLRQCFVSWLGILLGEFALLVYCFHSECFNMKHKTSAVSYILNTTYFTISTLFCGVDSNIIHICIINSRTMHTWYPCGENKSLHSYEHYTIMVSINKSMKDKSPRILNVSYKQNMCKFPHANLMILLSSSHLNPIL